MRNDQLRRGHDRLHGRVRGFGLGLSLEREGYEWTTVNANNVEALKEHASYAVHCRVDLGEIVDVHFAQAPIRQTGGIPGIPYTYIDAGDQPGAVSI